MPGSMPPAFDRFGDQLEDAARRRIEAERRAEGRRRASRRRKVALGTLAAVCVPAAAIAGATALFDRPARPLPAERDVPSQAAPAADPALVAASAVPDPDGGLPWALRVFSNPAGEQCVVVGRLRNGLLGQMREGRFRPLPMNMTGVCGDVAAEGVLYAVTRRSQPTARTVIYGLSSAPTPIAVRLGDDRRSVRPGALGTFVIVFRGIRDLSSATLEQNGDGRRIRRRLG